MKKTFLALQIEKKTRKKILFVKFSPSTKISNSSHHSPVFLSDLVIFDKEKRKSVPSRTDYVRTH